MIEEISVRVSFASRSLSMESIIVESVCAFDNIVSINHDWLGQKRTYSDGKKQALIGRVSKVGSPRQGAFVGQKQVFLDNA